MQKYSISLLLSLFLVVPFVATSAIFDGSLLSPYYFVLSLGSMLIFISSLFALSSKKSFTVQIGISEIILFLALLYIGANFLGTPFYLAYIQNYYILVVYAVVIVFFKRIFFTSIINRFVPIFLFLFLLMGFIEAIYGFWQWFNSFEIIGTFGNIGLYANYLSIIGIFAWGIFLYSRTVFLRYFWIRYFALSTATVIALVLPLTEARTAWLATIIGIAFVSWPLMKPWTTKVLNSRTRKLISLLILIFIAISALIFIYQYKLESAQGRLLIYEISLNMIKQKPIFGHGFCRFPAEYNYFQAEFFKYNPFNESAILADNVKTGFNEFIQIAVELGFVGLMLFLGFILILFRSKPNKEWAYLNYSAKGALIGLIVCCSFSYPLRILPVANSAVFLVAIVLATSADKKYDFAINRWVYKPFALALAGMALVAGFWVWKDFDARLQWKLATDYVEISDFKSAMPFYQKAYKKLNYDGFFLYNYGSEMLEVEPLKGVEILEKSRFYLCDNDLYSYLGDGYLALKNYQKAKEYYQISSNMVPCKFYPRYQLFKLYCKTNQKLKAKLVAQTIARMNVKIPSTTVSKIKEDIDKWLLNPQN